MTRLVDLPVFNPRVPRPESLRGFVESGGAVSIEAEHFTGKRDGARDGWHAIPGLGRTGDSVAAFPTNAPSVEPGQILRESPALEYRLHLFTAGEFELTFYLLPTHPVRAVRGLRFAVGLDREAPQIIAASEGVKVTSRQWSQNVMNATTKV